MISIMLIFVHIFKYLSYIIKIKNINMIILYKLIIEIKIIKIYNYIKKYLFFIINI